MVGGGSVFACFTSLSLRSIFFVWIARVACRPDISMSVGIVLCAFACSSLSPNTCLRDCIVSISVGVERLVARAIHQSYSFSSLEMQLIAIASGGVLLGVDVDAVEIECLAHGFSHPP